jgi:hypothetical protein
MNAIRLLRYSMIVAIGLVLAGPGVVLAQRCETRAVISVDADVYETLPRFVTGQGWRGTIKARLPAGTQVYVCWEQSTQFGLTSKVWRQVAFRSNRNTMEYGWVMKDVTRQVSLPADAPLLARLSPIGLAWAQADAAGAADEDVKWTLGAPPPQPQLQLSAPGAAASTPEGMINELIVLYAPLFLAMVLGMLAKATVDWLDKPIVFLGFLNAGQFSVTTQTYLVLLLLAFQNGFFWQTVLKRTEVDRGAEDRPK